VVSEMPTRTLPSDPTTPWSAPSSNGRNPPDGRRRYHRRDVDRGVGGRGLSSRTNEGDTRDRHRHACAPRSSGRGLPGCHRSPDRARRSLHPRRRDGAGGTDAGLRRATGIAARGDPVVVHPWRPPGHGLLRRAGDHLRRPPPPGLVHRRLPA
jgi:hypothetical protein